MSPTLRLGLALVALAVSACRGSAPDEFTPLDAGSAWSLADHATDIAEASCPNGPESGFEMSFLLDVEPVSLGAPDEVSHWIDGMELLGAWALEATPGSFGGLSGLDVLPSGDLLAVSDAGALIEIGFDQAAMAPTGQADLSFLRGADGEMLTGKSEADSEGLHLDGDFALVSFERNHRVLAFARGICGSNARGVLVSDIGSSPATLSRSIPNNSGAEGLTALRGKVIAGLEVVVDQLGPVGVVDSDGAMQFAARPWIDGESLPLVGLDAAGDTLFSLHRTYNPLTGNSILINQIEADGQRTVLGRIARPLLVDNFEGIAVHDTADGERRLFIVSDDNFSDSQQTLLYAFRLN